MRTLTTKEFINKAKKVHEDYYDYSKVNYINIRTKVTIICKIHGEFEHLPRYHLSSRGCGKCGGRAKLDNAIFIQRATSQHNNKYDYSKVEYVNIRTKVIIICQRHGEFKQLPGCHISGSGCVKCVYKNRRHAINNP